MVEWSRVHQARGRLLEDPVKEIAAMQLIGTECPNVLGSEEVLQDDDFLYSVMPYANGGDLFGYVVRDAELRGGEGGMSEPVARYWFRQILEVSNTNVVMCLHPLVCVCMCVCIDHHQMIEI
jgi:serine/threonine protein kinase